jgi:hypothetical protein
MILNVEVTAEMIRTGEQKVCARCPVALALRAVLGTPVIVYGRGCYTVLAINSLKKYTLPDFVCAWISRFDFDRTGSPFSFDLVVNG